MYRTHTCGALRAANIGEKVTLSGWVQRKRDLGGLTFIDLRDRYGITQLSFNMELRPELCEKARELGREFVVQCRGKVLERSSKNKQMPTGEIEIEAEELIILNSSEVPPFTIENETDGGEDIRMKYRYLDIRRAPVRNNLMLRHRMSLETRKYLDSQGFLEVETPYLIKSTPEGARDFVVPSRMNAGEFYALPQSPQTFKQLLMVAGMDKYYQIVKCFRDEDLRADRQPEFTQIDCEMSFVEQEDILQTFEGLIRHLFQAIHGKDLGHVPRMSYQDAMDKYGNDKPDIRFGMHLYRLDVLVKGKGFKLFDEADAIFGISVSGGAEMTRKEIDALTDWVKRPQIGAGGLIWCRYAADGSLKSSVDKFFDESQLKHWAETTDAKPGDMILVMSGPLERTRKAMSELRLHLGNQLGLRKANEFAALWVTDFPLLEWDEDSKRYHAMHHPFTSPKPEDISMLSTDPGNVRANAYDMVLNGNEIGGGSIRIFDRELQEKMFALLGFTPEQAQSQFGFLLNAFRYGAPPHGGIAFGFDRLVALFGGDETIRDYIAFPKNNSGRDVMIDAPAPIDLEQLKELHLKTDVRN